MEVKIYMRAKGHDAQQLLESITKTTTAVRVCQEDYDPDPIVRDVDVESKIICGKETIMSDPRKVVGIIDCELWLDNHMYYVVRPGEIVEFDSHRFLKTNEGYVPVEIKEAA